METTMAKAFAVRLRRAREALGFAQAEVAERAGVAVEAYGRLERGRAQPRAATLLALARALSVSTDMLLGHEGGPTGAPPATTTDKDSPAVRRLVRRVRGLDAGAVRVIGIVAAEFAKRRPRKKP